jgi:hypothetical protein
MKILVNANYSVLKDFIRDFAQNRKDDKIKGHANVLAEALRSLPKLKPIVEGGDEMSFLVD